VARASAHRKPQAPLTPNLPVPLTSFIGRDLELAKIKQSLSATRHLTLTGVGGCGKTRLALRLAADFSDLPMFKDGVYWIDLAALGDPALVPQAVSKTLGLREVPEPRLSEALSNSLRDKHLLLVLDNCEHLASACARLVETLLAASPDLKIVATSREPLGALGERAWLVPSLSMPDAKQLTRPLDLPAALQYDAIRLFVERATSIAPSFELRQENAQAIFQVCQRLDGIPLALELAATRINVLTVEQIAARLNDRFALLASGNRTALLPRHQTLRAALDWSYDLLSDKERVLFQRLSVFAGEFTLDAAEAVCSGEGVARAEILNMLSRLVDKSLVVAQTSGVEGRYHLLETIRQYGSDALEASGQSQIARRSHALFYCATAEKTEPKLHGPDQVMWLDRLEMEHENFRSALTWSLEYDRRAAFSLATALSWFWRQHNHFGEGRRWLDAALTTGAEIPTALRVKALTNDGLLAFAQTDDARATMLLEESLALARLENDGWGIAWSLHGLARVATYHRDYDRAVALLDESLAGFRELGDMNGVAYSFYIRGMTERLKGDYEEAWKYLQEGLTISRQVGDVWLIAWVLINSGRVAFAQGNHARALPLLRESLAMCGQLKTAFGVDVCFQLLAQLAGAQNRLEGAVRCLSLVDSMDETYRFRAPLPGDRADIERILKIGRAELGAETFAAMWAEGRALSLQEAVDEGLHLVASLESKAHPVAPQLDYPRKLYEVEPLNERELQVLRLIASGLSNHEIANQLTIALGTVKWHINNLFGKLGVHSRTQAIVKAKELGLV
jgi:predicted ATPase/DNA-binding CsgD family transcriptional regulator